LPPSDCRKGLPRDATGVGWVYQYVVLGAQRTLAELRTIQDWYLRYQLTKAEGVAEVASVGGFVQQYQVIVDPQKLQAYGLTLAQLTAAIRASNRDVGGRVVEMSETEYVVRGRGYLRNTKDLEQIALKMQRGTPVLLRDVARIELGPEERRGIAELNGQGEVVSGIALQRDGQNALHVIDSVKQKLAETGVTVDTLITEMDKALQFPGISNAWTMPIKARIDMLSTGIRTPIGVKVYGPDLAGIDRLSREIEATLRPVSGTGSAYAERVQNGYYLEITPDRPALARYGLTVGDLQETIATALGGETVTTTVEGRERYTVNVRYLLGLRNDPQAIATQVLVQAGMGPAVPLGQVASVQLTQGPPMIRTENAQLVNYIYVDMHGRDIGGYVADAQRALAQKVSIPPGYRLEWSGQYEYLERAKAKLAIVVPVTLVIIFVLLYLNFGRLTETLIVMLSVPFALVGGVWLMAWMQFNMSVAVAVGFIALAGVAAETGVVMLIYLDHALTERRARCASEDPAFTREDLRAAIMQGAVERVRPKMMTVTAIIAGLLPILRSHGTGSELMQRIAVPMIGGMLSSTVLTLIVIPAVYGLIKGWGLERGRQQLPAPFGRPAE